MCRWLAYSGAPLYLEEAILQPEHSLIDQSLAARASPTTTNGDGFGVGWYDSRDVPGVYREIRPAWNDRNLRDLAQQIRSPLFLAHVRAATDSAVQQSNCHPFRNGRWLFVHNGLIERFREIKRELSFYVAPALYPDVLGTTDSEIMFFLALTYGLEEDPIGAVERMVGLIERVANDHGIEHSVQMSVGISDGEKIYAFRYSTERSSRTLFHSKSVKALRELNPALERYSDDAIAVVSEPLGGLTDYWEEIPESTALTVHRGEIESRPFTPREP